MPSPIHSRWTGGRATPGRRLVSIGCAAVALSTLAPSLALACSQLSFPQIGRYDRRLSGSVHIVSRTVEETPGADRFEYGVAEITPRRRRDGPPTGDPFIVTFRQENLAQECQFGFAPAGGFYDRLYVVRRKAAEAPYHLLYADEKPGPKPR